MVHGGGLRRVRATLTAVDARAMRVAVTSSRGCSLLGYGHRAPVAVGMPRCPDRTQALKDDPQPQEPLEFGLLNLNPAPCSPST